MFHSHSQYVKKPYGQRTLPPSHNVTMHVPTVDMKKKSPLPPPPPVPTKKRDSWTEVEHGLFLIGLTKYGKGDWRRISMNVVQSKTPSQIASHAQKYFIRQTSSPLNASRKKRKSIHDITIDECELIDSCVAVPPQELHQAQTVSQSHPNPLTAEEESELMDYMNSLPPLPNCDFINDDDLDSLQKAHVVQPGCT